MLADVGLVHLNGRVYDPYVGRMLSADPVVGDPLNGQTWNRYSYVYNNPLAYTDPTGYCPVCIQTANVSPPRPSATLQLIGAIFRIAAVTICGFSPGCQFFMPLVVFATSSYFAGVTSGSLTVALQAGVIAVGQELAFDAVGTLTLGPMHTPAEFGSARYFANVAGHALVGCGAAVASGGKCGPGALSAVVPAAAGPFLSGFDRIGQLVASTTLGGLASVAGGGKFANGAVTGAFGYLFNAEGGSKDGPWVSILFLALSIDPLNENEPSITSDNVEDYLRNSGGRLGSTNTRQLNDAIATALENNGYTVTNGAGRGPEEWIAPGRRNKRRNIR